MTTQRGESPAKIRAPRGLVSGESAAVRRCLLAFAATVATCGLLDPRAGQASAFFIREQSAAAMGSAFADATAGAGDLTYMFFNGAALSRQSGSAVAIVGNTVRSQARLRDGTARTLTGAPIDGNDGGDAGGLATIPAVYGAWDLSRDLGWIEDVRLGLAINAPFGFETQYRDNWIGRYYAVQSRLRSVNFNPVISWLPFEGVSVGLGLQAQRVDAKLTNAVDFGSIGAVNGVPGAIPGAQDGFAKLTGDDWGFGWTMGLLIEPSPGTSVGVGYRSRIRHEVDGDARLRLDAAGIGAALGQSGGTSAAKANLTLPEIISFGLHQQLDDRWSIMAEAAWTRWSRYRVLRVQFEDEAVADRFTEEDWRDTWFLAGGTSIRVDSDWTLRCGVAWDQSPVPNRTRTPRTPANSGIMLALGATWQPSPNLSLAAAFSHFFIESARINLESSKPGNAARGDLSGSSRNAVDAVALQLVWNF
jgi:long-chain fatty acid transport protein